MNKTLVLLLSIASAGSVLAMEKKIAAEAAIHAAKGWIADDENIAENGFVSDSDTEAASDKSQDPIDLDHANDVIIRERDKKPGSQRPKDHEAIAKALAASGEKAASELALNQVKNRMDKAFNGLMNNPSHALQQPPRLNPATICKNRKLLKRQLRGINRTARMIRTAAEFADMYKNIIATNENAKIIHAECAAKLQQMIERVHTLFPVETIRSQGIQAIIPGVEVKVAAAIYDGIREQWNQSMQVAQKQGWIVDASVASLV